jgi:hypothetical protein
MLSHAVTTYAGSTQLPIFKQKTKALSNPEATPFRSFADQEFWATPSWGRVENILQGSGGAFGLYGPRGSGKSWLMLKAIAAAERDRGMGMWFPCPSDYQPSDFLSSLSDNLASLVEQRFIQAAWRVQWRRRAMFALAALAALLVVVQVVSYDTHTGLTHTWLHRLWIGLSLFIIGCLVLALAGLIALMFPIPGKTSKQRDLVQEATALRERIRYTTALKVASESAISAGGTLAASAKKSTERSLDERPATVASLVFDFRRLAERIVKALGHPLVIGIDELDKVEKSGAVRDLLRDIKGIFEIPGVFFFVSISEEAMVALELGPLQEHGRNEFNSSFYTVIELPSLKPADITSALGQRGFTVSEGRARLLCLLSSGNWRDMVRLAEHKDETDAGLAMSTLRAEVAALQQETVRAAAGEGKSGEVPLVWDKLPREDFESTAKFLVLAQAAILGHWGMAQGNSTWESAFRERWRGLLIRLFVIGQVIGASSESDITRLFDALIMAERDTMRALRMLHADFPNLLPEPEANSAELWTCEFVENDVVSPGGAAGDAGRRLALPMSNDDAGVPDDESPAERTGLLDFAGVSLDDLSQLDDSVVASVIRDLVLRRRCGTKDGECFINNFNAVI